MAEPADEVWAIEIYEGDKKRVETIKRRLPKQGGAEPSVSPPAVPEATDKPAVEAG